MLVALVAVAGLATVVWFTIFCLALTDDGMRGPIFSISNPDPVSRALLRSVQVAFVIGYGGFFVFSFLKMADVL